MDLFLDSQICSTGLYVCFLCVNSVVQCFAYYGFVIKFEIRKKKKEEMLENSLGMRARQDGQPTTGWEENSEGSSVCWDQGRRF